MSSQPLAWIRLELLPLADQTSLSSKVVWWNPDQRIIEGEGAQELMDLVESAKQKGVLQTGNGSLVEITDPLHQPTELAAVLAQCYWVIPQPVSSSGENPPLEPEKSKLN
ncbi:hypothetical protein JX580_01430 [Thiomicrospira microaerophila]|uniref:hypothetical protein n=1 Tax=Thiomicrospira microaerophila TaxID=406020 RepID=UPI00200F9354|nr:hypothetical protein [Thiomicrospira microaerophila]UQB42584.1 hypothetical protein JX580_01430 [Thiomicrospira microaerophila]